MVRVPKKVFDDLQVSLRQFVIFCIEPIGCVEESHKLVVGGKAYILSQV